MRFRLRSSIRDENTDARRLNAIERCISQAIAEAQSERDGLQRRIETARRNAGALLGNDTSEYFHRDPESEQQLFEAERNLIAGEKRIRQLEAHLSHLSRYKGF